MESTRHGVHPHSVPVIDSTKIFKNDIFRGKVLFSTGGGSGIGKAVVETLMRHGADAVIVGRKGDRLQRTAEELCKATGHTCIPAKADVRDPEQVKKAVEQAIRAFGRIDFVICGAAANFLSTISNLSENAFKMIMETDTLGTFNTIKATLLHMRTSKGSYIHITMTIHHNGTPGQAHVSAAKSAVEKLSAVLAVEEGPRGIRSNVLAPGLIANTPGLSMAGSAVTLCTPSPAGRLGSVKDIGNAAVYLLSDAAAYVTGQILVVDGGYEHVRGAKDFMWPECVLDSTVPQKWRKERSKM